MITKAQVLNSQKLFKWTILTKVFEMADSIPNLFQKLSLRHWYKYLLYLAGVLLVVGVAFGSQLPSVEVVPFSFSTMFFMIILWIFDDIIYLKIDNYNEDSYVNARIALHIIFFIIWVNIAIITLL